MRTHDQHDDDQPVGRVLSRREVLALLGGSGAMLIAGAGFRTLRINQGNGTATPLPGAAEQGLPACIVRPEQTEGPFFVDEQLRRIDVRVDPSNGSVKPGAPLRLVFDVLAIDASGCTPLEGAQVDIWSCDALGVYGGVLNPNEMWLRGYQRTNAEGVAEFITIYPGWYPGRAVHIHFKIRTDPEAENGYDFTSQLYFPDELTDIVHAQEPYASRGQRDRRNEMDGLYRNGGDQLLLTVTEANAEEVFAPLAEATAGPTAEPAADQQTGYVAVFDIGLDLSNARMGVSGTTG